MKSKTFTISIILFVLVSTFTVSAVTNEDKQAGKYFNHYLSNDACEVKQVNISFESSGYTLYGEIYYPSNETKIYPAVIFCEGYYAYTGSYNWIVNALAENGYVVMIFDYPGQGRSEGIFKNRRIFFPGLYLYLRLGVKIETPIQYLLGRWITATSDAITYLLEESLVKDMINNTSIGIIGHSLGGIAATKTATKDDRIDCVIALTHSNPCIVSDCHVPIQFQGGGFDRGYYSVPILLSSYSKANTPKELIMIKHGTHTGFSNSWGSFCHCPKWQKEICLRYAVGWFDYFLKQNENAYDVITTGTNHLSKIITSMYNFGDGNHILN